MQGCGEDWRPARRIGRGGSSGGRWRAPGIRWVIGDGAVDFDSLIIRGELHDLRRRRAADDRERALGALAADDGQHFAREVENAIDVWQPVHGADEDEVGAGGGAL